MALKELDISQKPQKNSLEGFFQIKVQLIIHQGETLWNFAHKIVLSLVTTS